MRSRTSKREKEKKRERREVRGMKEEEVEKYSKKLRGYVCIIYMSNFFSKTVDKFDSYSYNATSLKV